MKMRLHLVYASNCQQLDFEISCVSLARSAPCRNQNNLQRASGSTFRNQLRNTKTSARAHKQQIKLGLLKILTSIMQLHNCAISYFILQLLCGLSEDGKHGKRSRRNVSRHKEGNPGVDFGVFAISIDSHSGESTESLQYGTVRLNLPGRNCHRAGCHQLHSNTNSFPNVTTVPVRHISYVLPG